jgi:hypothetical protein
MGNERKKKNTKSSASARTHNTKVEKALPTRDAMKREKRKQEHLQGCVWWWCEGEKRYSLEEKKSSM